MLLIVIGIGLYYNVIIAWIIYYLIEVFISLPTGRLPWTTCGNRWTIENLKIVDEPFFSSWNTKNCMDINSDQGNDSKEANSSTSTAPQEFFSRKMLEISPGIDQVEFVEDPPLLYNYHSLSDWGSPSRAGWLPCSRLVHRLLGPDQGGEELGEGGLLHRHLPLRHPHRPSLLWPLP